MPDEPEYTYRGGERLELTKDDETFVVRALPDEVAALGLEAVEQVSSASTVVSCDADDLDDRMDTARESVVAHHTYRTADGAEFLITDRIYVLHTPGLSADDRAAFVGDHALIEVDVLSDRERLYQLTDATGVNPVKLVRRLVEHDDRVEQAENDANFRATTAFDLPTDGHYRAQWHLHQLTSHPQFDPRSSARCDEAWQLLDSYGSADVVIGITDDGCRLDHADFDSPDKFAGWGYFQGSRLVAEGDVDADPDRMYQTGSDHGTSCAGVAAGEVDGLLTVGAAPGCGLVPVKWESSGPSLFISDSKLRKAIDYMADRVDVMSNSWGIAPVSITGAQVTNRIAQLSASGGRRGTGIVFLWAAGNDNCPIDHSADQQVPYTNGWERQGSSFVWVGPRRTTFFRDNLVDLPGVMHVAAVSSDARRSHYSNYGSGIDISAPSNNSHKYLGSSLGLGVTATKGSTTSSTTATFGGTSSATPLVAGVAALVISANPDLSAAEVISVLQRTASRDLDTTPWPKTPPNNVMGDTSWDVSPVVPFADGGFSDTGHPDGTWSPWFGHGRVDALEAVADALAAGGTPPDPVQWEQTVEGVLDGTGDRRAWTVTFSGRLGAELTGPADADFDLHARRDDLVLPSASRRSEGLTSTEALEVQVTSPQRWRLTVVSWRGKGAFRLRVSVSE